MPRETRFTLTPATCVTNPAKPNTFTQTFDPILFKNSRVTLERGEVKNSLFYVSPSNNNNSYTYTNGATVLPITVSAGMWTVNDLNTQLQNFLIANNQWLLLTSTADSAITLQQTFVQFSWSETGQCCVLTATPVPSTLGTTGGYTSTNPNALTLSGVSPTLTFTAGFATTLGFGTAAITLPPTAWSPLSGSTQNVYSVIAINPPKLAPRQLDICVSLAQNPIGVSKNRQSVYTLLSSAETRGKILRAETYRLSWHKANDGRIDSIDLTFQDENRVAQPLFDPEFVITLVVEDDGSAATP